MKGSPGGTWMVRIKSWIAVRSFRSIKAWRLCSNTLNSLPRRKSTEQLPNCSSGSAGVILIFPCSRYRRISTSERTMTLLGKRHIQNVAHHHAGAARVGRPLFREKGASVAVQHICYDDG